MPKTEQRERMSAYLRSLTGDLPDALALIEKECYETYVPVIREETRGVLRTLLALARPARILEVGSAVGFSALFMAHFSDADITTIEHAPERICLAREHFQNSPCCDRITLLAGDAEEILPTLPGPYDFIFMDAAKGQYIRFLPFVKNLLTDGGVLVTDNVLRGGDILESHYATPRRDRTIHHRMREYLYAITHDDELCTTILADGDGIAVSVKTLTNQPEERG